MTVYRKNPLCSIFCRYPLKWRRLAILYQSPVWLGNTLTCSWVVSELCAEGRASPNHRKWLNFLSLWKKTTSKWQRSEIDKSGFHWYSLLGAGKFSILFSLLYGGSNVLSPLYYTSELPQTVFKWHSFFVCSKSIFSSLSYAVFKFPSCPCFDFFKKYAYLPPAIYLNFFIFRRRQIFEFKIHEN